MLRLFGAGFLSLFAIACSQDNKVSSHQEPLNLREGVTKTIVAPSFLSSYTSCEQIKSDIKERQKKRIEENMAQWPQEAPRYEYGPVSCGDAALAPAPAGEAAKTAEGVDFSGTNNQEKGIDEADFIKVDGQYFYVLNSDKFEIFTILENGNLAEASSISLQDSKPESFLLLGDKAFAFSTRYEQGFQIFHVDVIDIADRLSPRLQQGFDFEGGLRGARRIKDKLHLALYSYESVPFITWPNIDDDIYFEKSPEEQQRLWDEAKEKARQKNYAILESYDFLNALPAELIKDGATYQKKTITEQDCALSYGAFNDGESGFLSLITLSGSAEKSLLRVRGSQPIVYASDNQIILASEIGGWGWWGSHGEQQTVIHRFKLSESSSPYYADSVAVAGNLINSFSLSEYNGYVRVATTVRRDWQDRASVDTNHLFILGEENGKFDVISSLENIAPGETIWAARFYQDRAYLVTFERVDPLFTLDVSDPRKPFIVGELKVPGVSTYLQDIGNGELLAIGYDGNENGLNWTTNVSVFDVNDFSKPTLQSSLSLAEEVPDSSWSNNRSEANYNHLAINYFAPLGLVAIPISLSSSGFTPGLEGNDWHYWQKHVTKLKIVNVGNHEAISLVGEVDHSSFYNNVAEDSYPNPEIRRSYFVGNFLYAFSEYGVTVTDMRDMNTRYSHSFVQ